MPGMYRHCRMSRKEVCSKGVQHREGQSHPSASCPALGEGFSKSQHNTEERSFLHIFVSSLPFWCVRTKEWPQNTGHTHELQWNLHWGILLSLTKPAPSQVFFNIRWCGTKPGFLTTIYKKKPLSSRKHLRNATAAKGDFISFSVSTHSPIMELKYGVDPGNNTHQNKRIRIFERRAKHHKESWKQGNISSTQRAKSSYFA